ncbi:MAG: hypothetical protein QXW98_06160 [Candidatus Caldarchaeum sp.]
MDIHTIAGFLRGLIEAQKEEEAKAERERERGRQDMLLQMQLSDMLFRRQMAERERRIEEEKLQLMKEAHEWGRQKHEMEQRQNNLLLLQKEASLIAQKATAGLTAGRSPEQIAQELSALLGRQVTPEEVRTHANFDAVYQFIDETVKTMTPMRVDEATVNAVLNRVRSRFQELANHPQVLSYIQSALQNQVKAVQTGLEVEKRRTEEVEKIRFEKQKRLADIEFQQRKQIAQIEHGYRMAAIAAQGAQERKTLQLRAALEQRAMQQAMAPQGMDWRTFVGIGKTAAQEAQLPKLIDPNAGDKYITSILQTAERRVSDLQKSMQIRNPVPLGGLKTQQPVLYYSVVAPAVLEGYQRMWQSLNNTFGGQQGQGVYEFMLKQLEPVRLQTVAVLRGMAEDVRAGRLRREDAVAILRSIDVSHGMMIRVENNKGEPVFRSPEAYFNELLSMQQDKGSQPQGRK